ncbi:MAG: thioredoxin, partial [Oscillospiraceae bacterium]|nr:thioredoxin [Oscillospiraceae bacterium]
MAIQNANQSNFKELISEGFVLVDFWGTTCGPCKAFSRILEDTAAELPMMDIVK